MTRFNTSLPRNNNQHITHLFQGFLSGFLRLSIKISWYTTYLWMTHHCVSFNSMQLQLYSLRYRWTNTILSSHSTKNISNASFHYTHQYLHSNNSLRSAYYWRLNRQCKNIKAKSNRILMELRKTHSPPYTFSYNWRKGWETQS